MKGPAARASASAAVSVRVLARQQGVAARARRLVPAAPRRASKAARCRSIAACPSAASTSVPGQVQRDQSRSHPAGGRRQEVRRGGAGYARCPGQGRRRLQGARGRAPARHGELKAKLAFEVHYASKGAIAAVEKAGGSVKVLRPVKVEAEPIKAAREAKIAKREALLAKQTGSQGSQSAQGGSQSAQGGSQG